MAANLADILTRRVDRLVPSRRREITPGNRQRIITVRMPGSLYNRLRDQADALHVSLNALCLAAIDGVCEGLEADAAGELPGDDCDPLLAEREIGDPLEIPAAAGLVH